ncbi:MAG: CHASE2 domain-containing protein [Pseudomonadota bacterium]
MYRRLFYAIPIAILALALGLRIADPAALETLRMQVFDEYQHIAPRPYEDVGVRIVDIDDESLERLGQWPWPRTHIAELLGRLGELGAAVVAFDIVFAEPDRTSPRHVLPRWADATNHAVLAKLVEQLPDHDTSLAAVMREVPTVVGMALAASPGPRRPQVKWGVAVAGDDPSGFLMSFLGAVTNLPELEAAAAGQGGFNTSVERDGVIRRPPILMRLAGGRGPSDEIYPVLSADALRVAQGARTYIVKASGASGQTAFGEHTGINHVRVGRVVVPTDPRGRIWLHDTGPVPERMIPAWQLFEDGFERARIDGAIVFIGTSATGLKDIRATPLNPVAAGVEVHAQIAEQMLLGRYLERPDWMTGAELAWLVHFGALLLVLLARWGATWCAGLAVLGLGIAFGGSWVAYTRLGWLVDPVYPSVVALSLYLSQSLLVYLRTEAERRQVRGAFRRYMSPALVDQLARDPSRLRLGGEIRDMTLLFSDIRGFTSISEKLDAHGVTRFINRFLTPMTEIILARRGTIDKYMGDCIMAFWNAPLDDPDHVRNAASSGLAMLAELERLNAAWKAEAEATGGVHIPVAVGVGLNTGPVCVGNLGSEQRFDYSVIGDDVNLASRLEGQSKNYGVGIVIGQNTAERLPDFAAIELDLLAVKGKERPVKIYTLLGDEAAAAEPWFKTLARTHGEFLAAYRAQDWDRAEALMAEAVGAAAGRLDKFYHLYEDRIAHFRADPPPADWDAVTRATEK